MSAKRIFSAFVVLFCLVLSTSQVFGQTGEQEPEVKKMPKKLGQVEPGRIYMETRREEKPRLYPVQIRNISEDEDTVSYDVLSTADQVWLRYSSLRLPLAPGDSARLTITFSEGVLSQLQQFEFYDTLLVCFTASGPTVEGITETFVDTAKIPVHLKIRPTLTEKMAGWISKSSSTTINIIYLVFLGLFGTWVYFVLRNAVRMRTAKFIGEGVRKLRKEINEKIRGANPKISKLSREEYLDMLKKGKGFSPLFTCLRNAAAECEFYDSFENHSESVGKRIQDLTEKAPALSYFHVLVTVAPAIGFFGTLIGMSHLLMGRAITAGEAAEFARYISYFSQGLLQAIVTSIMGLFLLVLSMSAAFVFSKKAEAIQDEMFRVAQEITGKVKL